MDLVPVEPDRILKPAQADEPIPKFVDEIMSIPDYASPTHWLLIAIEVVTGGVNPAKTVAEWFTGDWQGVARSGDAFRDLAEFKREFGSSIDQSMGAVRQTWDGAAADAASRYFTDLAQSLEQQAVALETLAREYRGAAYGMWGMAKAAVSGLEMLGDELVVLALELAVTALVSETGVGALIGGGIAAYLAWRAWNQWAKLLDMEGKAVAAAHAFAGVVAGNLSTLRGLTAVPLPGGGYDNRSVN